MNRLVPCWLVIGLLLAATPGCGTATDKKNEVIPLAQIPPDLLKAARAKLPDVDFDSAYRETYNGEEVYEIRGKTKTGKIRECEVNAKGEVVNVE